MLYRLQSTFGGKNVFASGVSFLEPTASGLLYVEFADPISSEEAALLTKSGAQFLSESSIYLPFDSFTVTRHTDLISST